MDVYAARAGHPGLTDSSSSVAWKMGTDTTADWRGWSATNYLSG